MNYWYLQPILDSYWIVAALAALLLVALIFRPAFRSLSRTRWAILLVIRLAVVLCLILAMLRPTHVKTTTRTQPAKLVVMADLTRSMLIADLQSESRWDVMRRTLGQLQTQLAELSSNFTIQVYGFTDAAEKLEFTEGEIKLPDKPKGDQSDIGSSLYDVLRGEAGQRLAGVILLSDGAQRAITPRIDIQQPARELARQQCPLYVVPFGKPQDPTQGRDVALQNLNDHYRIFVKNQLELQGTVWLQGLVNREIPISLEVTRPDGTVDVVGPVPVLATQPSQEVDVALSYTPEVPGEYKLKLVAPVQPGELVADNNELGAYLTVVEGGLRVLYLNENIASQEWKWIVRSLDESPDIQLDFAWIDPRRRDKWPAALPQLDAKPPYDAYILGDLYAAALGEANCQKLATQVEEGRGLMMMGGIHNFGGGGYGDTVLARVLPVSMSRLERQDFGDPMREDLHYPGEILMRPTTEHFLTRLAGRNENTATWQHLPPLRGANRFSNVKDRAIVLAEGNDQQPLLIAGQYGNGRVLAFAGDSTFRWVRYGFEAEHKRFWRQVVLWLARKENLSQRNVHVRMERRRYLAGARAEFSMEAHNETGDRIEGVAFDVTITAPDGGEQSVTPYLDAGTFRGITEPLTQGGNYTVTATARKDGEVLKVARAEFLVRTEDLELGDPAASPELLEQLAQFTEPSGGRSVAPEDLPALLREIAQRPDETTIAFQSKRQLGDSSTDAWTLLLVFVGLLSVEWFLRKAWRMV
ncbi:MAG: hypothetical protein KDA60_09800 [Planctomycetales bacterium]|nr:hypothetical protein [Planctomycetales bacterium]